MAPLYHQIYLTLSEKIERGDYGADGFLPSERELAEMFGVSRITAIRTLNELAHAGLVVRERGRGTRVRPSEARQVKGPADAERPPSFRSTVVEPELQPFIYGRDQQFFPELTVDRFEYIEADGEVADALRLTPGDEVQMAVRTICFEGAPFIRVTTYVPASFGREWTRCDLESKSMHYLLRQAGVTVSRVSENLSAVVADSASAKMLGVENGSALLNIARICFDTFGSPVEYLHMECVPGRFFYNVAFKTKIAGNEYKVSSGPVPAPWHDAEASPKAPVKAGRARSRSRA